MAETLTMSNRLEHYKTEWMLLNKRDGIANPHMKRFYKALWREFRQEWYPEHLGHNYFEGRRSVKPTLSERRNEARCALEFDAWLFPEATRDDWSREFGTDDAKSVEAEEASFTLSDEKLAEMDRKLDAILAALPVLANGLDRLLDGETPGSRLAQAVNAVLANRLDDSAG